MSGGGGSANAAQGQNLADDVRNNPGTMARWARGERSRMLVALLPFIVVTIVAFIVSR